MNRLDWHVEAPLGTSPKVESQLYWFQSRLAEQMGFFGAKRGENRRNGFYFTLLPATLSAVATVSIGIKEGLEGGSAFLFTVIALVSSASASVLAAWEGFFGNKKLWVVCNETEAALWKLRDELHFRLQDTLTPLTDNEINRFHDDLQTIIAHAEKEWSRVRSG